jgi:hypothetical protein
MLFHNGEMESITRRQPAGQLHGEGSLQNAKFLLTLFILQSILESATVLVAGGPCTVPFYLIQPVGGFWHL